MTDEQIAEAEARANAATPGPWREVPDPYNASKGWRGIFGADRKAVVRPDSFDFTRGGEHWTESGVWMSDDDAAFIAAARTDVPTLAAEVKRLQAALADRDDLLAHGTQFTWELPDGSDVEVYADVPGSARWYTSRFTGAEGRVEHGEMDREAAIARARELAGKQAGPEGA